jgi:hypothetical protein
MEVSHPSRTAICFTSAANAERPNRGFDLNVAVAALRAGREPERTFGGIEDGLSAAAVWVIDELVEPHAGVWPNVQGGLVVKAQASNAPLVGANGLVSMDAATNPKRPGDAAVSGRRDAMGRTDLLLSGSWRSKQAEGTKPTQKQQTTTREHFLLRPSLP